MKRNRVTLHIVQQVIGIVTSHRGARGRIAGKFTVVVEAAKQAVAGIKKEIVLSPKELCTELAHVLAVLPSQVIRIGELVIDAYVARGSCANGALTCAVAVFRVVLRAESGDRIRPGNPDR